MEVTSSVVKPSGIVKKNLVLPDHGTFVIMGTITAGAITGSNALVVVDNKLLGVLDKLKLEVSAHKPFGKLSIVQCEYNGKVAESPVGEESDLEKALTVIHKHLQAMPQLEVLKK